MRAWLLVVILAGARIAAAAEDGRPVDLPPVAIHGFVSPGFLFSTGNDYLADSTEGSFEFTEVGLNLTTTLTDELRLGLQLFARDLGPRGGFTPTFDWFYLDYRLADWLGFRAGRTKLPFGLYNEVNDIDQARVPILLPQSVYPVTNRDFLLAQTGAELYGYIALGGAGALDYRVYAGTIFLDADTPPGSPFQVKDLVVRYLVGGRLLWETPLAGLRVGGSVQAVRLDTALLATAPAPATFELRLDAVLWVVSAELAVENLLVAAEYGRWHVSSDASDGAPFPEATVVSERVYAMVAYRVLGWLQPGLYYSLLFPDTDDRTGRAAQQHDVALTLRFDINDHWLVKAEVHYMAGTAGTEPRLNDDKPKGELEPHWAVFLVKTTAWF